MNKALIIFIKNAVKGKVKTRLAATIGQEQALSVYLKLLEHTRRVSADTKVDCLLFYSNHIEVDDAWDEERFKKFVQVGADLGERMKGAFELAFERCGYEQVAIIGSDCADLTTDVLNTAFEQLADADVVIGPSNDGGYYLLGMKRPFLTVFDDKNWSTASVLEDTITDIKNANLTYHLLSELTDIDTESDLLSNKTLNNDSDSIIW